MTSERDVIIGDATLTASGIARLAGVGRAAVSNWRRRFADFPAPVGGPLTSPNFNARDVEHWLRRHGKLHQAGTEQWAWRHIENHQPATQIGDALGIAGAYLLARSEHPGAGLLTPKQLTGHLRAIDPDLATLVSGILPARWDPQLTDVLHTVDQLAREQDPEAAFEYLHSQYVASAQSMSGLAGTPDLVAELMLTITGRSTLTLDFTCGTGSILRMAANRALEAGTATRCLGQEIKPQYALIALIRLWFVHRRAQQAGHSTTPPALHVADSMLADAYTDVRVDAVVANFPFGIHDWGHDRLAYDSRWVFGMPPRTEPELAWVQHALAHLTPTGTAVVLMPPSAAVRPAGRRIRAELVRRGALRAVVALPAGLMPPTGIGLHIWALTQPDDRQPSADRLLFVDATATDQSLTELVATAWHDYLAGGRTEMTGVHRTIPAIEILNDQVDLTPQRYLTTPGARITDPARTLAGITDFGRLLMDIRKSLPEVQPATTTSLRTAPQASLVDLVRSGSMSLFRASTQARSTRSGPDRTVRTSADILPGAPPSGTSTPTTNDDTPRIQSGDILIPLIGRNLVAAVVTTAQTGAEPGPGVQILRIDLLRFDPWFVAGVLTQSDTPPIAGRTSGTRSGGLRSDLKRRTIPVLTLHEQQQYGLTFRLLAEFRTSLQRAAAIGAALAHEISEGLTSGALTVPIDQRHTTPPKGLSH